MGTAVLACPGVRDNGMTAGIIGSGLTPTPPVATFTPFTPLLVLPEEVNDDAELVHFSILYRVLWGFGVFLWILKSITLKRLVIGTPCINLPW